MNSSGPEVQDVMTHPLALMAQSGISASQLVMLLLAVAALTLVMLATRRRFRESKCLAPPPARERYSQLQDKSNSKRDLEQVMLELDELSRQIHGRIDTKLARLEAIIGDADRRIEKLSALVTAAEGKPASSVTFERNSPRETPSVSADVDEQRYAAVYRLSDSGKNPEQIAREVGRTTGEVELILALRKARRQADAVSTSSAQANSAS